MKKEDLKNNIFGRLKVVEFAGKSKNSRIQWKCLCDCGNNVIVTSFNLKNSNTKSCGCLQRDMVTKHGLSQCDNRYDYIKFLEERNIGYKLHRRVSSSVLQSLKVRGFRKNGSILKHLPYAINELKNHLELLWESWMNWKNYGGYNNDIRKTWHIDHIIPQSSFNIKEIGDCEFLKCWNLSNLRPLEKISNIKKGNKIYDRN